jgi:hypothetical protein
MDRDRPDAAKALGIDLPASVLARADEVIEVATPRLHHAARQRGRRLAAGGRRLAFKISSCVAGHYSRQEALEH